MSTGVWLLIVAAAVVVGYWAHFEVELARRRNRSVESIDFTRRSVGR